MNFPNVSIIILNWNGKNDTIECLESLKKITYPNYTVIVVDNGSEGDDIDLLRKKFGDYIHVIENDKNYEFAEGNNIGIRYALRKGTSYILLLNNDTVVDPGFLNELIKIAESDKQIGMVGPKIYFYDTPDKIWFTHQTIDLWRCKIQNVGLGESDGGQYNSLQEVDCISGCAMLVKREIIEKVGMLDPGYLSYYEDTDWCIRIKKNGYKMVYVPKARLWHKGSSSTGGTGGGCNSYGSLFRAQRRGRNRLLLMRKNANFRHWLVFPFFALINLIRVVIREIYHGNGQKMIALIKGISSNISFKKNE